MTKKEYIERQAVIKIITQIICDTKVRHKGRAINRNIKQLPAADVQEVRHGEWVKNQEDMYWGNYFIRRNCSICGGSPFYQERLGTYKLTPYCPNCGAKMDKE